MSEYESVCAWMAKRGYKGRDGDPLPVTLSASCALEIESDPDAFERRIREHAYRIAMERHNLPEY
jgi:hypothetical protein